MASVQPLKERRWLSKKDVMRYLGISKRTLEYWTSSGILRQYKIGKGRVFLDQYEVDEDIVSCKISNANRTI